MTIVKNLTGSDPEIQGIIPEKIFYSGFSPKNHMWAIPQDQKPGKSGPQPPGGALGGLRPPQSPQIFLGLPADRFSVSRQFYY